MFQSPTKDEARARIAELVENFERQLPDYQRGAYNETQTRRDFIDPFFQALGWDIDNRNGAAEAYREVIHEDKVKVGKATKAPDYSFRLPGGQRLFFVEAKKPSVKIKEEILPAYQVRRYGWSAKLALSILTDFEELAVYDCTLQPAPTDKAAKGRLKYLTFREYEKEFDFLWDTFSKESVLRGGLDKFVATGSSKRGKETVDAAFLTTLEAMRAELAQGLATRNPKLDADELRFLVQMLLDRIIFLRIAEDRGIEPYADLQAVARVKKKDEVYVGLLDRFRTASARYNSGLFDLDKDTLSAVVRIDNAVLAPLLQRLYYPESPYEFSVIGAEILGSAYERFLGKVITLEAGRQVRIEDKPEVRKAGGVFYTPAYIVDYIVKETLGARCEGRTPQEVAKLRVLDPACGSGSFLLGAYQYLLDWHLAYYQAHPTAALPPVLVPAGKAGAKAPARRGTTITPDGRLSSTVKKAILLNNLYGVDLDAQAVEVTKLSLLLKCLEGETPASIQHTLGLERVLPTIDRNIRVGNSLVETDFYDELDFAPGAEKDVKPFSWHDEFAPVFKQGGFDVVIGNPPWVDLKGHPTELINYYFSHYKTASNRINLYALFIEKATRLIKPSEFCIGIIIPNSLLYQSSYADLRNLLLTEAPPRTLVRVPDNTFANVKAESLIVVMAPQAVQTKVLIYDRAATISDIGEKSLLESKTIAPSDWKATPLNVFDIFSSTMAQEICAKMEAVSGELSEQCEFCLGLTPYDKYRGHTPEQIKERAFHSLKQSTSFHKPLLAGGDVSRYSVEWKSGEYIKYGPWLGAPREARFFTSPRILVRQIISGNPPRIYAAYTEEELYNPQSLFAILLRENNTPERLQVLLGILNSSLLTFYHANKYLDQSKVTFQKILIQDCKRLPIINIDSIDKKTRDAIAGLVNQLSTGYATLSTLALTSAREQAQVRLRHLERRLDGLVCALYGLSNAEIAQVAS